MSALDLHATSLDDAAATPMPPGRMHRSSYTDPLVFEAEMLRVFGGTWVYLAHESELPRPGDFTCVTVGLRPVIVCRDGSGQVHALLNRCAHRASTVCQEKRGSARRFQCDYHGWTYDLSGELLSVPYAAGYGEAFDRSRYSLRHFRRVASYRGFVFGSLDPEVPELTTFLAGARERLDEFIDRSPGGELRVQPRAYRMLYRGNWKHAWDNAGDGYHPVFAHRSFLEMNATRHGSGRTLTAFAKDPDETPMYGESLGNGHIFVDQRPGAGPRLWQAQRPVPARETYEAALRGRAGDAAAEAALEVATGSFVNLSIFPNLLILGNQLQVVEPQAVDRTCLSFHLAEAVGAPDEVNRIRVRVAEDFPSFGTPDDVELYERTQEALRIGEVEWLDFTRGQDPDADAQGAGARGVSPVTHDLTARAYQAEWARLMARPAAIERSANGHV